MLKSATERILCCTSLINRFAFPKTTRRQKVLHVSLKWNVQLLQIWKKVTLNLKMHSAELFYLRQRACEILPTVKLKPSSLSSPSLPPLTCAGCVLQAAPLPEGGEGLVFGPRGPGGASRGQVGGHVPRLCGSGWLGWVKESWVSQSCRRRSVGELQSEKAGGGEGGRGEERQKEEGKGGCGTDDRSLRGFDCSQRKSVYMCVYVCVMLRACEQGFPKWLVQCWAAEHPSAAKQAPPPPKDSHAWAAALMKEGVWWRGLASPHATHTHTVQNTQRQQSAVLLLPWQPQICVGKSEGRKVVVMQ